MAKAIRDAYGEALLKYGGANPDVVVLDADVSVSTKSCLFSDKYPDRFFNVGIAESNMTGMAAGFATAGKIPFVNTFAIFLSNLGLCAARGLVSYSALNVKLMGAFGGLSDSYDGPSHHAMEDLAIMRTLPHMRVLCASDAIITDWMVQEAIDNNGPMYIRLSREAVPNHHQTGSRFAIGKGIIVREGMDATIIACGIMVSRSLAAAQILSENGLNVRVVDMFTIKPLDTDLVRRCARETGTIITVEEHSTIGGLGSAVAEEIARSNTTASMEMIGIDDRYTETGSFNGLLAKYGLDEAGIAKRVSCAIRNRKTG
ncbi:MAG: transketolase family protein [Planctomycetes bacterium]|nr:transketolase family protein [Planctomycetota bacterium]